MTMIWTGEAPKKYLQQPNDLQKLLTPQRPKRKKATVNYSDLEKEQIDRIQRKENKIVRGNYNKKKAKNNPKRTFEQQKNARSNACAHDPVSFPNANFSLHAEEGDE